MLQHIPSDIALARLAAIVDSSDDAIVSKRLDGVIMTWNAAAERMFGFTASEAIGRHITLIIPPERRSEENDVLAGEGTGGKGASVEHHQLARRRKDRVDRHQHEYGVEPVIADQRCHGARQGGEHHQRGG